MLPPRLSKLCFCYSLPIKAFASPDDAVHVHALTPQLISLLLHNASTPRFCSALLCFPLLLLFPAVRCSCFSALCASAQYFAPALPFDSPPCSCSAYLRSAFLCSAIANRLFALLLRRFSAHCFCRAFLLPAFAELFVLMLLLCVSSPCSCFAHPIVAFAEPFHTVLLPSFSFRCSCIAPPLAAPAKLIIAILGCCCSSHCKALACLCSSKLCFRLSVHPFAAAFSSFFFSCAALYASSVSRFRISRRTRSSNCAFSFSSSGFCTALMQL